MLETIFSNKSIEMKSVGNLMGSNMRIVNLFILSVSIVLMSFTSAGDKEIKREVKVIKTFVEQHDWEALLLKCDPEHYNVQVVEIGINKYQYIAEILGLNDKNNSISPGKVTSKSDLQKIKKIKFKKPRQVGNLYKVSGKVTLKGGGKLKTEITLVKRDNDWFLTGSIG